MTISHSKAYSECTVTGPLIAAIIGTWMSRIFSRIFVPSRRIFVVSSGREEVESVRRDLGAEFIARAGQDDDVVLGIVADVTEGADHGVRKADSGAIERTAGCARCRAWRQPWICSRRSPRAPARSCRAR